jgi:hypothetical protein
MEYSNDWDPSLLYRFNIDSLSVLNYQKFKSICFEACTSSIQLGGFSYNNNQVLYDSLTLSYLNSYSYITDSPFYTKHWAVDHIVTANYLIDRSLVYSSYHIDKISIFVESGMIEF